MKKKQTNNYDYLYLIAFLILGLVSMFFQAISDYLLLVILILWIVICYNNDISLTFSFLLFFISFERINFNQCSVSFYQLMQGLFVLVYLIKKILNFTFIQKDERRKKYSNWFAIVILTIVYILFTFLNFNFSKFGSLLGVVTGLLMFELVYCERRTINKYCIMNLYIISILISGLIGIVCSAFSDLSIHVYINNRFVGLCLNANTFQFLCLIAMSFLIILYKNHKMKLYEILICLVTFLFLGLQTKSKAFLLLSIVLFIFLLLAIRKESKKKCVIFLIIFSLFAIGCSLLFMDKLVELLNRFSINLYENTLDKITTGRYSLWIMYLASWASNPISIIFGKGITATQEFYYSYHSEYVRLIYENGILGILILSSLIIEFLFLIKKESISCKKDILPLIVYLIVALEECVLGFRVLFVLAILLCIDVDKKIKIS